MSFALERDPVGLPLRDPVPRPSPPAAQPDPQPDSQPDPQPGPVSVRPAIVNLGYWGDGAVTAREAQLTFVRRLADRLPDLEGRRVLDASHGPGGVAAELALEYGADVDAINVEKDAGAAASAYASTERIDDRLRFHSAQPAALPFPEASFDVVFSIEAAHGFPDKAAFLTEARRVLRPGGMIALADMVATREVPIARHLWFARDELPTARAWRMLAGAAGFERIEQDLVGNAVYPGHRRWLMLSAAERRQEIKASLAPPRSAPLAAIRHAEAWWLEFVANRSAHSVTGALGLREYMLLLGRRPAL
jgi:erythromycin 3''-O-methyltransferase